jgi:hypothetical protein
MSATDLACFGVVGRRDDDQVVDEREVLWQSGGQKVTIADTDLNDFNSHRRAHKMVKKQDVLKAIEANIGRRLIAERIVNALARGSSHAIVDATAGGTFAWDYHRHELIRDVERVLAESGVE